jgi:catechol 2,3-dioxygenase-like lactoylglutathione lyase family enzyme
MKKPLLVTLALTLFPALLANGQGSGSRPPITGISHISVYVTDAGKAEAFYVHDLGAFKATDPENSQGVRYYFSPSQFIEVLPLPQGNTSINRLDHVAFATKDAEGLRKYMGANGIAVPSSVETGPDGSHWFEVKDPEDNKVQFVQAPAKLPQVPLDPLSSRIIHVGYMVHSRSAEDPFYRTVLGFHDGRIAQLGFPAGPRRHGLDRIHARHWICGERHSGRYDRRKAGRNEPLLPWSP